MRHQREVNCPEQMSQDHDRCHANTQRETQRLSASSDASSVISCLAKHASIVYLQRQINNAVKFISRYMTPLFGSKVHGPFDNSIPASAAMATNPDKETVSLSTYPLSKNCKMCMRRKVNEKE